METSLLSRYYVGSRETKMYKIQVQASTEITLVMDCLDRSINNDAVYAFHQTGICAKSVKRE